MVVTRRRWWLPYVMVLPAFAIMMMVVVFPIINTVVESFHTAGGQFTVENYSYFFGSDAAFDSLIFTIEETLWTTLLSTLLGWLLALYLRFGHGFVCRLLGRLYLLPRFIPGIAAVYGVMNVIKDSGFIARFCRLIGFTFKPGLLYSMKGIVISNLWFSIPFATMMMSASLSAVSDSYIESARDVGCNKLQVLRSIILPLTYRDIVLAATFIGMGQIASFTIPYLTGPNNPKMLGILLYTQVATYLDYQRAAALSVLIFLLCLVGALVYIVTNLKEDAWQNSL